jgi:alginate O-acetyltransferase complex protein AlgI
MNFNTALFLFLFLPFFLIAYFIAQPRWRPWIGVGASLVFYAWGDRLNLVWIGALILVNYYAARWSAERAWTRLISLGVAFNVGILLFFKLFTAYRFDLFFGLGDSLQARAPEWFGSLPFPLGLSFVSFQAVSYLLDVRAKRVSAEKNFLSFAFYVLMFPKLLAGPIVRYRALAEALPAPVLDREQIADGMRRFMQGFVKKILLADTLARTVDAVFDLPVDALASEYAWLGLVGYALQIYFDFSGYTDMAVGLASMMGFRFVENFNYPYLSESIGDFWRRWHISLSTWFRDYVFYPLERKRLPVVGQSLNILAVFLLTGLWHGVTLKFIVWGGLHGIFLALESVFLGRWLAKWWKPFRHAYALSVILLTWLIFRSPDLDFARGYLRVLVYGNASPLVLPFQQISPLPFIEPTFLLALGFGILFSMPIGAWLRDQSKPRLVAVVAVDAVLLAAFVLALGSMASGTFVPGIYANF